jgi:hypothetical protein
MSLFVAVFEIYCNTEVHTYYVATVLHIDLLTESALCEVACHQWVLQLSRK